MSINLPQTIQPEVVVYKLAPALVSNPGGKLVTI